jgi:hypothetical protein
MHGVGFRVLGVHFLIDDVNCGCRARGTMLRYHAGFGVYRKFQ